MYGRQQARPARRPAAAWAADAAVRAWVLAWPRPRPRAERRALGALARARARIGSCVDVRDGPEEADVVADARRGAEDSQAHCAEPHGDLSVEGFL